MLRLYPIDLKMQCQYFANQYVGIFDFDLFEQKKIFICIKKKKKMNQYNANYFLSEPIRFSLAAVLVQNESPCTHYTTEFYVRRKRNCWRDRIQYKRYQDIYITNIELDYYVSYILYFNILYYYVLRSTAI